VGSLNLRTVAFVAVGAVLLVAVLSLRGNRDAIARARAEAAQLTAQRDSLGDAVRERDQLRATLQAERRTRDAAASRLRDSVTALETRRASAQLDVRTIGTVGELQSRLRAAFPQLGQSGWRLTNLPLMPGDTIGIEYLMVPAWFAETFVIDHQNAESWRAQKDGLLAVDSLRLAVIALQDSNTRLVAANATAYQTGYDAAMGSYQGLSRRHIAELGKPGIRLGSALGIVGAAGACLVVGRVIP